MSRYPNEPMAISRYRKAIAAVVVPVAVFVAARYGFDMPAEMVAALTTLIAGATVYAVPNA